MSVDKFIPGEQQKFYEQLFHEIASDLVEQRQHDRRKALLFTAIVRKVVSHLGLWEFDNLTDVGIAARSRTEFTRESRYLLTPQKRTFSMKYPCAVEKR